jgi:hypothetical protein
MGTMQYDTLDELSSAIASYLNGEASRLGVSIERNATIPEMFRELIVKTAATSDDGQVVVLVDEYDSTAKKAIEQIQDKSYTDRFRASGKPITLIGIAFSTKRRTVSGVKIVKDA